MSALFARAKESRKDRYLLTLFGLGKQQVKDFQPTPA